MSKNFDVVVIGGGPGGYIAAIRAAQLGLSVACIDAWQNAKGGSALGGTCTNVGCIPSKALLQSSEHFEEAGHGFAEHGIGVAGLTLDLGQMQKRKDKVVQQNNDGITYLFKKNKVTSFLGRGSFTGRVGDGADGGYEIRIAKGAGPNAQDPAASGDDGETVIGKHVIVATGSNPRSLPGTPFDEERVLSNTGALALREVPKRLCLIGAGVIGLEMGSVWRRLGAEVTVLEALPTFLAAVDEQIAKEAKKSFDKQGLHITLNAKIGNVTVGENDVTLEYTDTAGTAKKETFDRLVVSIGRVPNTDGLNAAAIGLHIDERGYVVVDGECHTNVGNVWGIGDVVRGPMLAHKAEEEGVAVAERIVGQKPHIDFNTVPWVIYTHPEIAWVGQTEQSLKSVGRDYKAGSFPFLANGRARALGDTTGMVKVIADAKTDEILGVHMVGPGVSELIAEAVVAMEFKASAEDIARICHAHPSLSEATKEAALAVDKRTLNF